MNSKIKKALCVAVAGASLVGALSGCSNSKEVSNVVTYWAGIPMGDGSSDAESIPFVQYLHEATGIDVDFTIASSDGGQRTEQFNILIASNEYPDIMESNWAGFKGGAQGAIDQKVIVPLNQYMDEGKLPNFVKYLEEHPEIDKLLKTDSGEYYTIPFIREDDKSRMFNGPILRKDWLDELGKRISELTKKSNSQSKSVYG